MELGWGRVGWREEKAWEEGGDSADTANESSTSFRAMEAY